MNICLKTFDFKRETIFEKNTPWNMHEKKSAKHAPKKFNDMQDDGKKLFE